MHIGDILKENLDKNNQLEELRRNIRMLRELQIRKRLQSDWDGVLNVADQIIEIEKKVDEILGVNIDRDSI